jgi:hypothetical protein
MASVRKCTLSLYPATMRSTLILHHPWREPQQTLWYFSADDDATLRGYAEQLAEFEAADPDDRNEAALVLRNDNQENPTRSDHRIGAWTAAGATKLAELLPESFSDVRNDIVRLLANPSG